MVMQVRRTLSVGATPTGLSEGQISVGMADQPPTAWVGVPTSVNPLGVIPITGLVRTVAGAPQPAGALGQLWWDEDAAQLFVYTGSEWVVAVNPPIPDLSQFATQQWVQDQLDALAGPPVYSGPTAPPSPAEGDLWFNTTTSTLMVYQSGNWVASTSPPTGFLPLTGGTVAGQVNITPIPNVPGQNALNVGGDLGVSNTISASGRIITGTGFQFINTNDYWHFANSSAPLVPKVDIWINGAGIGPVVIGNWSTGLLGIASMGIATSGPSLNINASNNGFYTIGLVASDRKLKDNLEPAGDALAAVNALPVYSCDLHFPSDPGSLQHWDYAVIADEVEKVNPAGFVAAPRLHDGVQTYQSVRELPLIAMLVKAVQQLTARVTALEAK